MQDSGQAFDVSLATQLPNQVHNLLLHLVVAFLGSEHDRAHRDDGAKTKTRSLTVRFQESVTTEAIEVMAP